MSGYENLLVEAEGGVTRIVVNRPRVLNALNQATLGELEYALSAVSPQTRVVVVTGAGEKAFVAGADISEMADLTAAKAEAFSRLGHRVLAKLAELTVPTIAEVNGFALGGGCELMLACDFALASQKAQMGLPEVGLGVIPGFGGTVRLTRRIGSARARQLIFTGARIKADEALRIGLVNEVLAPEALRARTDEVATAIAKNAPKAVMWAKRSARLSEESNIWTASAFEQEVFGMCFSTEDQTEGMKAFLDKRGPEWKNR